MERPRISLFGPPALQVRESRARFRTKKHAGLLAYLALEARDRPVERERLIELFWPGVPDELARHSLSQALTAIRQHLGTDALVTTGDAVQLRAAVTTDLDALSSGAASTSLAEPLQGLDACAGPALAHWVDAARVRARTSARDALIEQMGQLRGAGEIAGVHDRAKLLFELDPFCETAVTALAERALLRGDGVGAIRLLREHAARTRTDLGCAPSQDLARLLTRLEAGSHPPIDGALALPGRGRTEEPFVGRAAELAALEAGWTRAREGTFETILLLGPAGIGKSSLLRRFATGVAARAAPVFLVTCQEIGHGVPFAALGDLLLALARDPSLSGTDPLWLAEASRVCPALRTAYPGIPEAPPAPADSIRLRLGEALFRMLETIADGAAVLLGFDDVQHMDPASRDVLFVVARRLVGSRTLIIGAARSAEGGSNWRLPEDSEGLAWHIDVPVTPLTKAEAVELVDLLEPRAAQGGVTDRIGDLGQGNPYFIEMLLDDWERHAAASLVASAARGDGSGAAWQPPPTMRSAFERQYSGMSEAGRAMLHLLAVAGRAMPTSEIASLLGRDESTLDSAAIEAIGRGILRVEAGELMFKNELHRAFVYYAMSADARRFHHGRLARALEAQAGDDFGRTLEAAHHYRQAGMITEAVAAATAGSQLAIARGAPQEAERALRAVSSHLPDGRLPTKPRLLLSESLVRQGRHAEGLTVLPGSVEERLSPSDRAQRACLNAEAMVRGRLGTDPDILASTRASVDEARASGEAPVLVRALQMHAEAAVDVGDWAEVGRVAAEAERMATTGTDDLLRAHAEMTAGYCDLMRGLLVRAHTRFANSTRAMRRSAHDSDLPRAINGLAICSAWTGDPESAIPAWREALEITMREGDFGVAANICANLGTVFADYGHYDAAKRELSRGLEFDQHRGGHRGSISLSLNWADLFMMIGQIESAGEFISRALATPARTNLLCEQVDPLLYLADLELARGNAEGALAPIHNAMTALGSRPDRVNEPGRLERLRRWRRWILDLASDPWPTEVDYPRMRLSDQLELWTSDDWLSQQQRGADRDRTNGLQMLKASGLVGVVDRLKSVAMLPS
jgi:DNA-binding SARP family transcriptional activator/tetratricopeptide (TPR) repeat protein